MSTPNMVNMKMGEEKKRRRRRRSRLWSDHMNVVVVPTINNDTLLLWNARADTVSSTSSHRPPLQQNLCHWNEYKVIHSSSSSSSSSSACTSRRRFLKRTSYNDTIDIPVVLRSSFLLSSLLVVILLGITFLCQEINSFHIIPSVVVTRQQYHRTLSSSYSNNNNKNLPHKTITTTTTTTTIPRIMMMMMVQKLEPLTQTSEDRRSRAMTAMNRAKVEQALIPMDRLSSQQFLSYSSNHPNNHNNNNNNGSSNNGNSDIKKHQIRKGRPESVLGAMTQQTMIRYLEHQSAMKFVVQNGGPQPMVPPSDLEVMVIAPYMRNTNSDNNENDATPSTSTTLPRKKPTPQSYKENDHFRTDSTATSTTTTTTTTTTIANDGTTISSRSSHNNFASTRQRRKLKGIQSTTTTTIQPGNDGTTLPTAYTTTTTRRKSVFKNLPKPKKTPSEQQQLQPSSSSSLDNAPMMPAYQPPVSKFSGVTNGMDIKQYYRTELLTSDEEYALGMKIQFMDQCEQVHEGLASTMNRLPTIEEWAKACGFMDVDPQFVSTEADEQLRPVGSDAMFDDIDPNMFVGNGLAHQTGPGSGRGRAKRIPPLGLKDYYDDSEYRRQLKLYLKHRGKDKSIVRPRKSVLVRPINRGTPTDFVEILMTAHEAKQRMVQSNMRLVISIARKYYNAGVSLQDLVQEGSLGLSRAAEKFEPKKGFKFSTYASWWIQQAVFRSIAYHSRTIRLPVHVHNLLNRVRKVRNLLHTELGRVPTNEEIAGQLGMSRQKFNKMLHLTKQSISLEAPKYLSNPKDLGHESDDLLGETISKSSLVEDEATPQRTVDQGLFHEDLKNIMKILDDDEHRVICARYGLHDGMTRTATTVAAQMKQSKAWVRSQECRALRKLRRPWYEKKLKEHQDALAG